MIIDDVNNSGDGSDMQIRYSAAADESKILEYRVYLHKQSSPNFDRASAEAKQSGRFMIRTKTGADQDFQWDPQTSDTEGGPIQEGETYVGYVLSVADGINADINTLSEPSNSIAMAQTTIKITYIGNDGVMISAGDRKVLIDALPGNLDGWIAIPSDVQSDVRAGEGDFEGIDYLCVTHSHGDHFSPSEITNFLNFNPGVTLIGPPQVTGSFGGSQISSASPARWETEVVSGEGIKITILHMKHFDIFGNDFSMVENYSYIVEIEGVKVAHFGDFEYSEENLEPFVFENITTVMLPTFSSLISDTNRELVDAMVNPEFVIGLHLQSNTEPASITATYPGSIVFNEPGQFIRL